MKFSEAWLREWVNPTVNTAELAAQLTMAGLEVDAIEPVAGEFHSVVVGEVLAVEPHPDADKLHVCQVNVGQAQPLTIVCGAKNVAVGMKVPTALIGAQLPGNIRIKQSKLRGVESHGMLCSAKELGLAETSDGLLPLSANATVGADVRNVLQLNDVSITLGLTPNRGDCLSVVGIAREVAAIMNLQSTAIPTDAVRATHNEQLTIKLDASTACPRYCGRVIRNIKPTAVTPWWMQEKLRRSGLRSLGPIVDVTNYVLLELGQPMHAFDWQKLQGGVTVRMAKAGESLALLNDTTVQLTTDTLVIADDKQPIAMAGVMGGSATAVSDATKDIFLESAHFAPLMMAGKARQYGLHTDSSHRFERGVSVDLPRIAMERATKLIIDIAGGEPGPIMEMTEASKLPQRAAVTLREARIARVLGSALPTQKVTDVLKRLGMNVTAQAGGWTVIPPAYRFDIAIEEDLIEEVARVIGYNQLPMSPLRSTLDMVPLPEAILSERSIRQLLVDKGYQEAITYSFVEPRLQALLDPEHDAVLLANPISAEMAAMRTSLWPGLIQTLLYNLNRQQNRVMLFECGLRFHGQAPDFNQVKMLAGIVSGTAEPLQWGVSKRQIDFFDAKGHLETMFALTGHAEQFGFEVAVHPALHPGKSARITRQGRLIGWIGVLHPQVAKTLEISQEVVLFDIEMAAILSAQIPQYRELSRFPAIRRDIAVVVAKGISAQQLSNCVKQAAPRYLQNIELFDVYTGEGIDSGRKSVALGLTLQDLSRTLTDSEVEGVMQSITARLQGELGALLR